MTRLYRIWFTLLVLAAILLLSTLQAGGSSRTIVGSQQSPVGSGSLQIPQPTGALATSPLGNYFDHLVVIMMENEGINDICGSNPPPCNGSNTPYMSSLANSYGISQQYLSLVITSWPNYYGILGAFLPSGCSTINPGPCYPPAGSLTNPNLIDRFEAAGLTWKGYMESQGVAAGCVTGGAEPYTHEHNGFVAFQDITNNTSRCSKIVLANPGSCGGVTDCALINDLNSSSPPSFMWLTPNDCNDMRHWSGCGNGCTSAGSSTCIRKGDNYLNSLVPNILNSNTFTSTRAALFITFDEGSAYCPLNNSSEDCLYAVWAGPVAKTGFSSPQLYNQYSLTKTIEVNWNLTTLTTNDAAAIPMTEFFRPLPNFTISATSPGAVNVGQTTNSIITVTSANGFSGTVALTDTVPGGLTCSTISPSSVIGSGTATLSCSSNTAGRYTATVTGTSASLTHSANATFNFVDFTITASSPPPVNVEQSPTSTITIDALNGFAGIVALTDTIPSGLTCGAITPTSITGAGTATVSCSATAAANYTLSLTGSSGSLTHPTTAIFRFQDFTINASSPPAFNAGSSTSSTITIAPLNDFAGTVTLTDNIPSGLSCGAIVPSSITPSTSAAVSCTSSSAGNYTLTVTGTSGSVVHSTATIFRFQDFNITTSVPTAVKAGVSATSTITVTALNHFSGTVSLTDTVPNGLTCGAITPGSVTGSGTATVSCSATVAGNYTLTTTGASTSLAHGTTATFMIQDFTVSSSSPPAADAGVSVPVTITVAALNHFNGLVNLASTVPSGLTCGAITPSSITGSGSATVSCSGAVAGNYTLTITATSTPLVHTAAATFQFQDFTISMSSPASMEVGVSAISTVTVTALNHFAGTVSLTYSLPAGLTCGVITPTSLTGSGTATVSCSATAAGTYTLTFRGTAGLLSHGTSSTIQAVDFSITGIANPQVSPIGTNATSSITLTSLNGYSGNVNLTATVAPPQVGGGGGGGGHPPLTMAAPWGQPDPSFNPMSIFLSSEGTGQSSFTIILSPSVPAGNYLITVTASDGTIARYIQFTLIATDFILSSPMTSLTMNAGSNSTQTLNLQSMNGFQGSLTLSASLSPNGPLASLSPSTIYLTASGNSSLLTIVVPSNTAPGTYTLTVQATSGTLSHTIYITITVQSGFTTTLSRILNSNSSASIAASAILGLVSLFSIRSAQTLAKTRRRTPRFTMKGIRYPEKPRHLTARPYSNTFGPLWTVARDVD